MYFSKFYIYPSYPETITLQWDIDNKQLPGKYTFIVSQSNNNKDFTPIAPPLINTYQYKIRWAELLSTEVRNSLYFKVECTPPIINPQLQYTVFSQTIPCFNTQLQKREFLIAKEINRKENLRFEKLIGMPAKVLKRKNFGELCTHCVDKLTGSVTNSSCLICYGTRFVGGYYNPVDVYMEIVGLPVEKIISEFGTTEVKVAQLRFTNEILLDKQDVIVDTVNNNRWKIAGQPELVMYRTYPISQQVQGFMVNPKDITNKIGI